MFNYLHIHRTENIGKAALVGGDGLSPAEYKRQCFFSVHLCVFVHFLNF